MPITTLMPTVTICPSGVVLPDTLDHPEFAPLTAREHRILSELAERLADAA